MRSRDRKNFATIFTAEVITPLYAPCIVWKLRHIYISFSRPDRQIYRKSFYFAILVPLNGTSRLYAKSNVYCRLRFCRASVFTTGKFIGKSVFFSPKMEEPLINRTTSLCNGNVTCNGHHGATSSMTTNDPQEAVSNTLVFYVNGKEVRAQFSRNLFLYQMPCS